MKITLDQDYTDYQILEENFKRALNLIKYLVFDNHPCPPAGKCDIHMEYGKSCIHKEARNFLREFGVIKK